MLQIGVQTFHQKVINMMSREDWEKFWKYLMRDFAIIEQMGCQQHDSVAEHLEWIRQDWLKWHDEWPTKPSSKSDKDG